MARNLKFYLDDNGNPCARGPLTEQVLMKFLEIEINSNDHVCHDLMEDLLAVESEAAESREFIGKNHTVVINGDGVEIQIQRQNPDSHQEQNQDQVQNSANDSVPTAATANEASPDATTQTATTHNVTTQINDPNSELARAQMYQTDKKHFREIIEDWEAFILDETE